MTNSKSPGSNADGNADGNADATSENEGNEQLRERAMEALKLVDDPEVGINVVDLGLIYGVDITGKNLRVRMTMTTAACPLGEKIVEEIENRLGAFPEVAAVSVELVWDPPWTPARMTAEAKQALGWPGG